MFSSSSVFEAMCNLTEVAKQLFYDAAVLDALNETAFTIAAFFAVWFLGRALGLGRKKKDRKKKVNHFALTLAEGCSDEPSEPKTIKRNETIRRSSSSSSSSSDVGIKKESDAIAKAVRLGNSSRLPSLIDAAKDRLVSGGAVAANVDAELLLAALRACASRRVFGEALAAYDHVSSRLSSASGTIWSLLYWSAVETSEYHRCDEFLANLRASGTQVSNYDFVNMTRHCVYKNDAIMFGQLVKEFQEQGCEVDLVTRNRALSTCVSASAFDMVELLITNTPHIDVDVIALNTLMKGYATIGKHARSFELYTQMRSQGLVPSEMTYGVLIDSLIDAGEMQHVRSVFADLKESGLQLNVVLWTTFIKGLVKAGDLTEAVKVLEDMISLQSVRPDLVTFSTIMRAQALVGDVMESLRLLEMMIQQGLTPDEVVFHTVLTGCSARRMESAVIVQVLDLLIERGLKPSTTTLSVLVKAFAKCEAWSTALEFLEKSPKLFRLFPEARIYAQLGQASAQARCGEATFNVYLAMVQACALRGVKVDKMTSQRLLRLCVSVGEGERANAINSVVSRAEGAVDSQILDEALRNLGPSGLASERASSWRRPSGAMANTR